MKWLEMISPPSRKELRARGLPPFRPGRNWTKADIFLWEAQGGRLAIKDYSGRPAWFRMTLGRYLLGRECAAYRLLQGIPGIPPFAGRIDAWAMATAYVEGVDLSRLRRGEVPARFFPRLLELLDAIHRAGVAQGDLHHRDVILGASGEPSLVDFSTAAFRPSVARGIRHRIFRAACNSDRRAALKLKRRHTPGDLTEEEARFLDHPPAWYRLGKGARRLLPGKRGGRRAPREN
jgi:predicted Ser/Thr protein kinase